MLSKEEKIARLRLARTDSVGVTAFWEFINAYGSAVMAIDALSRNNTNIKLCSNENIVTEIRNMKNFGARYVFLEDELYPPMLRDIHDPPPILSFIGNKEEVLKFYKKRMISVVGGRNSSIHANKFCNSLCRDLGTHDIVIVSGLARGIDASAHSGALQSGTIAILACGINIIYPTENKEIHNEIVKHGGIFAEMPFDTPPHPQLFPRRNRIIAGMSSGTVVIEAADQSGSLITAKMALEYGRDVFAVPGFPLDLRCAGSNKLLKDGAILVQSYQDITDHMQQHIIIPKESHKPEIANSSQKIDEEHIKKIKEKILNSLSSVPITIDELISCIKVSPREVLTALLELELDNKIIRLHGQRICLALDNA